MEWHSGRISPAGLAAGLIGKKPDAKSVATWDMHQALRLPEMPKWRNGRRAAFRAQCPYGRVGSTPTFGTSIIIR